jgi:hypothetical protein
MRLARIVLVASSYLSIPITTDGRVFHLQLLTYQECLRAWWIKPQLILSSLLVLRYVKVEATVALTDYALSLSYSATHGV